ncbi:AmmeMemoRadiSam system radical SAM enzyme [Clostridium sp. HMP27]|uniref:AmmeMemoRadiSam system radical SAM enzyme n=1 Tax=Clostridium sp. HMP27 TaxID=1487921 RepID=UPI000A9929B6|nr:AmmeMemoRadiSam system radical SAM enzyme [Clostridium sp. HMP27]
MLKEAMFYKKIDNDYVICNLCPHNCHIKDGGRGLCGPRKVHDGKLYNSNYGEISSISLDPIEKKPLYHYKPGSYILSVGSFGCNFKCGFCQNYSISQHNVDTRYLEPEDLINLALEQKNNVGIAFTYNEPSIWYEYIWDVSKKAVDKNIDIVLVSNGYISKEPLKELLPYISAMNIDLKAFKDEYYKDVCKGDIKEVLENIKLCSEKTHVEITTLLVNGYNDSEEEVEELCKWIASVDKNIPVHFSRYFPSYQFKEEPTPVERVLKAKEIGDKYLNYVYIGNVPGINNNTYCPKCNELVIKREGYEIKDLRANGKCKSCDFNIK